MAIPHHSPGAGGARNDPDPSRVIVDPDSLLLRAFIRRQEDAGTIRVVTADGGKLIIIPAVPGRGPEAPAPRVDRRSFGDRLAEIRRDAVGESVSAFAEAIRLPRRTWENYERGVTVPAEVVLRLIVLTSVDPGWLLGGEGPRYRRPD